LLLVVVVGPGVDRCSGPLAAPVRSPDEEARGADGLGSNVPAPGFWNGQSHGDDDQEPDRLRSAAGPRQLRSSSGSARSSSCEPPFGGALLALLEARNDFAMEEATITVQRAKGGVVSRLRYFDANQGRSDFAKGFGKSRPAIAALRSRSSSAHRRTRQVFRMFSTRPSRPAKERALRSTTASSTARRSTRVEAGKCDALILDVPDRRCPRAEEEGLRTAAWSGRS